MSSMAPAVRLPTSRLRISRSKVDGRPRRIATAQFIAVTRGGERAPVEPRLQLEPRVLWRPADHVGHRSREHRRIAREIRDRCGPALHRPAQPRRPGRPRDHPRRRTADRLHRQPRTGRERAELDQRHVGSGRTSGQSDRPERVDRAGTRQQAGPAADRGPGVCRPCRRPAG